MNTSENAKGMKSRIKLILLSVIVVTAVTAATLGTYPFFYSKVVAAYENPLENMDMMSDLNKSSYILYKNLYEKVKGEAVSFGELYVNEEATVEKYQDSKTLEADEYEGSEYADYLSEQACKANVDAYFRERLENDTFKRVEQIYEYAIRDMTTGVVVTNTDKTLLNNPNAYLFRIEMEYDKNGNATIIDLLSENQDNAYKNMSSLLREKNGQLNHWVLEAGYGGWDINEAFVENYPSNCRIVYGVKPDQYAALIDGTLDVNMPYFTYNGHSYYSWNNYHAAMNSGYRQFGVYMILAALALALFLPVSKILGMDLKRFKVFRLPAEGCCALLFLVASAYVAEVDGFISLNNGSAANKILAVLDISSDAATFFSWVWYGMGIFLMYLVVWYIGLCLSRIRTEGFKEYIKSSSLIYRIFPFTKKKVLEIYDGLEHFDLTKDARKTILKIVLVNAVILFIISCLWFGGFMVTIVYSIVLYLLLKVYISGLQKRYGILLSKINQISSGDLNVAIPEDLGVFEPFKLQLLRIQAGFRNAVEAETKSQRMKAELITNVSHDLKTPLTAIITYVDLLKDENLTEEQRKEYLDTLERKSLRLKVLIEDLFEVSKASSGNVTLNPVDVDICNLLKQAAFEVSDKMEASGLDVKMTVPEEKIICTLDSQNTYRIFENLLNNIAKYSMPSTRVYINCLNQGANVLIELKNISAVELKVTPEELSERFVRGDASRNTEGSGLGLAIAKSFTELQGGHMSIQIDGDLFKVVTVFPEKS